MHKRHLALFALAFLMCCISIYFGVRIYNANENIHLTELNEIDHIVHDDVELVPALNRLAAIITLPLILSIIVLEIVVIIKTVRKVVKNVAIGLLFPISAILVVDVLTLSHPHEFDFSKWGFVWICLGLFIIAGNLLSFAIYRLDRSQKIIKR